MQQFGPRKGILPLLIITLTVALPLAALRVYDVTLGRNSPSGVRGDLASLALSTPEGPKHATLPVLSSWERLDFDAIAGWLGSPFEVSAGGSSELRINGAFVSEAFFEVTGLEISRGQAWGPGDPPTRVVLGAGVARSLFGTKDPVGSVVRVGETSLVVSGIVKETVRFPVNQQIWVPMALLLNTVPERFRSKMPVQILFRAPAEASERGYAISRLESALAEDPDLATGDRVEVVATPAFEAYVGDLVGPLRLFLIITWCLFGIGAITIVHFRTLEESQRRKEYDIRAALGATLPQRLVAGMRRGAVRGLTGSLTGAVLAVLLGHLYARSGGLFPAYWVNQRMSSEYLMIVFSVIVLVTSVTAVAGTWHARGQGASALNEIQRTVSGRRKKLNWVLLLFEITPVAALLVLALGTSRSVFEARDYWYGEDPERIVAIDVGVDDCGESGPQVLERLEGRLESLGQVEEVAFVTVLPVQRSPSLTVRLLTSRGEGMMDVPVRVGEATKDYFEVIGAATDLRPAPLPAAVVSSSLARRFEGLVGAPQVAMLSEGVTVAVYDVVGTARELFLDWDQFTSAPLPRGTPGVLLIRDVPPTSGYLVARVRDAKAAIEVMRDELARVGPVLSVGEARTYSNRFEEAIQNLTVVNGILWNLTFLVLTLSVLGVYAISLQQVAARNRELSIRSALGATVSHLSKLALSPIVVVALTGSVLGGLIGWRLSQLLQGAFLGGEHHASIHLTMLGSGLALSSAFLGSLPPLVRLWRSPPGRALRQD